MRALKRLTHFYASCEQLKLEKVKTGMICCVTVLFCVLLCCDLFESPSALFTAPPLPQNNISVSDENP